MLGPLQANSKLQTALQLFQEASDLVPYSGEARNLELTARWYGLRTPVEDFQVILLEHTFVGSLGLHSVLRGAFIKRFDGDYANGACSGSGSNIYNLLDL